MLAVMNVLSSRVGASWVVSDQRWKHWALLVCAWSLVVVAVAVHCYAFERLLEGGDMSLASSLWYAATKWYVWVLLTPIVVTLARLFPLTRERWLTSALALVVASCVVAALKCATHVGVQSLVHGALEPIDDHSLRHLTTRDLPVNVGVFWAIVTAFHALGYYRRYRERTVRALELETQVTQAQLRALRMQLHPHFMFNALNTISSMMYSDVALANSMLVRLSALLRHVLECGDEPWIPLEREIELAREYLDIERLRFADRLVVDISIDEDVADAMVPTLILQPLIENAIKHGISRRTGPARLDVSARRDGRYLHLHVRDDGPGMAAPAALPGPGVGLANTRERLEKLYGSAYRLELSSGLFGKTQESGEPGFAVDLELPYQTEA